LAEKIKNTEVDENAPKAEHERAEEEKKVVAEIEKADQELRDVQEEMRETMAKASIVQHDTGVFYGTTAGAERLDQSTIAVKNLETKQHVMETAYDAFEKTHTADETKKFKSETRTAEARHDKTVTLSH